MQAMLASRSTRRWNGSLTAVEWVTHGLEGGDRMGWAARRDFSGWYVDLDEMRKEYVL